MDVYVSRDSVCAGDDVDAPHGRRFRISDRWTWESLIDDVWRLSELPRIAGGRATWALSSGVPLAVIAQEWDRPELLFAAIPDGDRLDRQEDQVRLHWSYFGQEDPRNVSRVLQRLRLRAIG